MTNAELVQTVALRSPQYLDMVPRSEQVLKAMLRVDRALFLPGEGQDRAYSDEPLPIGFGQTCSEPSMVAFMLDKLALGPGQKVLEIGTGCGYAAAIATLLVQPGGILYGVEIIPELCELARRNLASLSNHIELFCRDGSGGLPDYAPFDRIFLSAGVPKHFDPAVFLSQLGEHGSLIYPETRGNLYCITKEGPHIITETYYGVAFVPLNRG
jgi:protein-L-isoaspartate(D-aspartate) O-methyltransferase